MKISELIEAQGGWRLVKDKDNVQLVRFSGKTFPVIMLKNGKITARNDNSSAPSKSQSTTDLTVAGVRAIIQNFSEPAPSDADIEKLLTAK